MTHKDKKFCPSHSVSQESYLNDGISSNLFKFFKILILGSFTGVKGQKMTHNYQFQSVTLNISRTVDHIIKIVGTQV